MASWNLLSTRDLQNFVYPRVWVEGPAGRFSFAITELLPYAHKSKGELTIWQRMVSKAAVGKVRKILKALVHHKGVEIEKVVMKKLRDSVQRKEISEKVNTIWRKERRRVARQQIQQFMTQRVNDLTDYDVREAWKTVKRETKVKGILGS